MLILPPGTDKSMTTFEYKIHIITKTCLYNFDSRKPHFYIVKLGFTGVYIIFLISARNIDCEYSLEPPHRGGSNEYPQSMFWTEIWKISEFFIWKFSDFGGEIFYMYLNRHVFVMVSHFNWTDSVCVYRVSKLQLWRLNILLADFPPLKKPAIVFQSTQLLWISVFFPVHCLFWKGSL